MKYILKYSYYIIISIIFTLIISGFTGQIRFELLPIILLNLYILRLSDDYFDYDTDNKEKLLTKSNLKILLYIFSGAYVSLNIIFYEYFGLISIIILVYMIIENKIEFLKMLLLSIESIFYIYGYSFNGDNHINNTFVIIYLVFSVICSIAFYIYKTKRRNKKNDL